MHSISMKDNYFEKPGGCLFCFDDRIVPSSFPNNANKLFENCCKYLHSAIISETQKCSIDMTFGKENVAFCEKCLESAVELSTLMEQQEYYQRTISEFIFIFSLRILHRRKKCLPNRTRKLEEFDISGLPDVVDNDFSSSANLAISSASPEPPFQPNDICQQIITVNNSNVQFDTPEPESLIDCDNEFLDTSLINVDHVKIENPLNDVDFCEDSFKFSNIIVTTSSSLSATGEKRNISKPLSKEEIASSRLPIVKLERLKLENHTIETGRKNIIGHRASSTLKIANVKSLNPEKKIVKGQRDTSIGPFELVNAPGVIIKLENITEDVPEERVVDVVERKRYDGDVQDEEYDPRLGNTDGNFKCRVCKKKFRFKCVLQNHEKTHSDEKPFCCDICGKAFKNKHTMLNHGRIHTGEKPFECSVCHKRFTFQSGLITHKLLHTGEKRFQCSVCKKRFTQKSALISHYNVHTGERRKTGSPFKSHSSNSNFECDVCGKTMSSKQGLIIHQSIHTGEKAFQCSVCFKSFRQSSNLHTHMKIHTKPYKCPTCGQRFSNKIGLNNHISRHTGETVKKRVKTVKDLNCSVCFKTFKQSASLYMHMQRHTKPHQCQFCQKRFVSQEELDAHIILHDEQELQCRICEKTFASKQTLIIHENIHTGEKPFQCSVCLKSFRQASSHHTHMKVHTKPNKCPTCGKRFALKTALERHISKHKGEKRHQCTLCPYAAVNPSSLKIHVITKHSESKCQCRDCGKIFPTSDQVKSHYKRIHFAIDYTEDCVVQLS